MPGVGDAINVAVVARESRELPTTFRNQEQFCSTGPDRGGGQALWGRACRGDGPLTATFPSAFSAGTGWTGKGRASTSR